MGGLLGIPPGVWSFLLTVLMSGTLVVVGSFLVIRWFPSEKKKASAGGGLFGLTTVLFFFFILAMSPLPGAIAVGLGYAERTVVILTITVQVLVGVVSTRSLR